MAESHRTVTPIRPTPPEILREVQIREIPLQEVPLQGGLPTQVREESCMRSNVLRATVALVKALRTVETCKAVIPVVTRVPWPRRLPVRCLPQIQANAMRIVQH